MSLRALSIVIASVVFLAGLTGVLVQGRQLAALRAEHQGLVSQPETRNAAPAESRGAPAAPVQTEPRAPASPSLELLRLRAEVTRLTNRRRELTGVDKENERLRVQIAANRTNMSAAKALPPDYVRKSEARFVGYNTPADTMQSLLWAVQNRDFTNLLAAFTPETARQMQQDKSFFENVSIIPGMHIRSQQQMPDGAIELEVEMVPGEPLPERMRFLLINGQWKLDSH